MAIRRKFFSLKTFLLLSFLLVLSFYGWRYRQKKVLVDSAQARIEKQVLNYKKVAIVIDDIAARKADLKDLENFLSLNIPITFAVLPESPYTKLVIERIQRHGDEIIIHQPMEPEDIQHNNPGESALFINMKPVEINGTIKRSFKHIPQAVGLSNHMGSRFTSDAKAMTVMLKALKNVKTGSTKNPPFFFDSRTTSHPVSKKIADKLKISLLQNDLFLDQADTLDSMLLQIARLKNIAFKNGSAAGIGHIQRKYMARALKQSIPELEKEGIKFVYLSELVEDAPTRH